MIIDAFAFARNGQQQSGDIRVSALPRLEVLRRDGSLYYHLRGFLGERGRSFLALKVEGSLLLRCERCLLPVAWPIAIDSVLWLAPDEAAADAEPVDKDDYDPVVGSDHFVVEQLIEDEVLLAIPTGPKHEHCPEALEMPKQRRESPFAALAKLKSPQGGPTKQ